MRSRFLRFGRFAPALWWLFAAAMTPFVQSGEPPKDELLLLTEKTAALFGRQYEWKVDTVRQRSQAEANELSDLIGKHVEELKRSASPVAREVAEFEQLKEDFSTPKEKREVMNVTARLVSPTLWSVTQSLVLEKMPNPVVTTYVGDGTGKCFEVSNGTQTVTVHEDARAVLADLLAGPANLRILDDLGRLKSDDCQLALRPPLAEISYFGPRTGIRRKVVFDAGTFEVQSVEDLESRGKLVALTKRVSASAVESELHRIEDGSLRKRSHWALVDERDLGGYSDKEFQPVFPPNYTVQVMGRDGSRITLSPEDGKNRTFQFGP